MIEQVTECEVDAVTGESPNLSGELMENLPERIHHGALIWADKTPNATALMEESGSWSYADLREAVTEACGIIQRAGVRSGDRIMLVAENCRALVALILAASELDAWVAIVNGRLSAREIDLIREDFDPRVTVYTLAISESVTNHAKRHQAKWIKKELIQVDYLGEIAISAVREVEPEAIYTNGSEQVIAVIYTSGTTGKPKGVMLTHHNIAFIAAINVQLRGFTPRDRLYACLPIAHVFGLATTCMGGLFAGGSLYLTASFTPASCVHALKHSGISVLHGVPTIYTKLVEYAQAHDEDLSCLNLRYLGAGGAPLDPMTKYNTESLFGLPLHNAYGMTECSPSISGTRIDSPAEDCSVGKLVPGLQARFLGLNKQPVAPGEVGELWVRGINVMKGYFRNAEQTRAVMDQQGWFNTEDLACLDEKGNLSVVGRTKEMIIRSGFNVYPAEVEAVISAHPQVSLCAVVGRTVQDSEEVMAFVQPNPGAVLNEQDLKQFCRERLSPYKCPSRFVVMEVLPSSPTGKILKGQLKQVVSSL